MKATGNNTFVLSYGLQDHSEHHEKRDEFAQHGNRMFMMHFLIALQAKVQFSLENDGPILLDILMNIYHKCGNNNFGVSSKQNYLVIFKNIKFI